MLLTLKVLLGGWDWRGSMCLRVCAQTSARLGWCPGREEVLDPGGSHLGKLRGWEHLQNPGKDFFQA